MVELTDDEKREVVMACKVIARRWRRSLDKADANRGMTEDEARELRLRLAALNRGWNKLNGTGN